MEASSQAQGEAEMSSKEARIRLRLREDDNVQTWMMGRRCEVQDVPDNILKRGGAGAILRVVFGDLRDNRMILLQTIQTNPIPIRCNRGNVWLCPVYPSCEISKANIEADLRPKDSGKGPTRTESVSGCKECKDTVKSIRRTDGKEWMLDA